MRDLVEFVTIVDLRINETLKTGAVRIPPLPFSRLVGTVSNSADPVRLQTAPTGGESVYLLSEFTIIRMLMSRSGITPERQIGISRFTFHLSISCSIALAASRGLSAAVIGRPTTM